jgi:ABC-2 type transport system ATP-binding protein
MKANNSKIAIQLIDVSKKYEIHHEKPTLAEKFVKGPNETFWALRDINLTIKNGERVGIIGPNGSGKTTILKIIAGITSPSSGEVITKGKIVSLIDLTAGFHPDLTGIQNIFLNGMLIGMSKNEISKHISSIIAFADIRQFIDVPMYTYSSGMALRLGFAVAVHANPDILILDEGISVGDKYFQQKVHRIIREYFHSNKTILTVTHQLEFLKDNCTRILTLNNRTIEHDGGLELLTRYEKSK